MTLLWVSPHEKLSTRKLSLVMTCSPLCLWVKFKCPTDCSSSSVNSGKHKVGGRTIAPQGKNWNVTFLFWKIVYEMTSVKFKGFHPHGSELINLPIHILYCTVIYHREYQLPFLWSRIYETMNKIFILCLFTIHVYKMYNYFLQALCKLIDHIDGSVQDCSISSVLAMEILQSCTKPLTSSCFCHPCYFVHTLFVFCPPA